MATPAQQYNTLTTYYLKRFEEKHGRKPVVNRNVAKWSWRDMMEDLTVSECKSLVDFYMKTEGSHNHSLSWFFNHYDELIESKRESDSDQAMREKLREETRLRTQEGRNKRDCQQQKNDL